MSDYIRGYAMLVYNKRRELIKYIYKKYNQVITLEQLDSLDKNYNPHTEKWVLFAMLDLVE
jgi:hypothetical protein